MRYIVVEASLNDVTVWFVQDSAVDSGNPVYAGLFGSFSAASQFAAVLNG